MHKDPKHQIVIKTPKITKNTQKYLKILKNPKIPKNPKKYT